MQTSLRMTLRCVLIGTLAFTGAAHADDPVPVLSYEASSGQLPINFGWKYADEDSELKKYPGCPTGESGNTCRFIGLVDESPFDSLPDNDGTILPVGGWTTSRGGRLDLTNPASGTNNNAPALAFSGYHVVYPPEPVTLTGTAHRGEWVEFDDDGENLEHVDTTSSQKTPKGAENYPGAPAYQALRLVGGDGNGVALSLPSADGVRNDGKIYIRQTFIDQNIVGPVTVVFRGALSATQEGDANEAFLRVRKYDPGLNQTIYFAFSFFNPRTFSGGVPICDAQPNPSGDCGKFSVRNYQQKDGNGDEIFGHPLIDGHDGTDNLGIVLPNTFFTFRVICDPANGGTATIYLNEDTPNPTTAVINNATYGTDFDWGHKNGGSTDSESNDVRFGLTHRTDWTAWVDYVRVYAGAVPPPEVGPCTFAANPVFDVRDGAGQPGSNGVVDGLDFTAFANCATGPTPDPGAFPDDSSECYCMDINQDLAIDQSDFAYFQKCLGLSGQALEDCDDQ